MNYILPILNFIGLVTTTITAVGIVLVGYWTFRGLIPALFRLGYGLQRRRIAIVATGDSLNNLEGLIGDSRLFNNKRIIRAAGQSEIEAISRANLILINWPDCRDYLEDILLLKSEQTALIVYAPHSGGRIENDDMAKLEQKKHVVVCNFRGRLMNDIVTSMITTGYEKK